MLGVITAAAILSVNASTPILNFVLPAQYDPPVMYCQNDPGDHVLLPMWELWPTNTENWPECNGFWGSGCVADRKANYLNAIHTANRDYRLCICEVWNLFPNDPVQREQGFMICEANLDAIITLSQLFWKIAMEQCCAQL